MSHRDALPEHPVSALAHLANVGRIPRPVYVGEPLKPGCLPYAVVVEVEGFGHHAAIGDDRADARRKAATEMLGRVLARICPDPTKSRYATWEAAYDAMLRILATSRRDRRPDHAYGCRCGWWHLSSTPSKDAQEG